MNLIKIYKERKSIAEGIANYVFKKEHIEEIAQERFEICYTADDGKPCPNFDISGEGCEVPGTQPCCSKLKGGCGCSLKFLTRSLSSSCVKGYWDQEVSSEEEDAINKSIKE